MGSSVDFGSAARDSRSHTDVGWPAEDLERRLIGALDFAAAVVSEFGESGYADEVRPALGFGPEKVIAEATMLAYAAAGVTQATAVVDRVDALARQLVPHVRSPQALADMVLNPDRVFKRCVPHVLLSVLGFHDDLFDDFAFERCQRTMTHAVDEPATVHAERRWIGEVWKRPLRQLVDGEAGTALHQPLELLTDSREDAYGLTHLLFYVSDFGRAPRRNFGRPIEELLKDVDALVVRYLDEEDYDLTAELLMAWPQLREPWSPTATFAFRVLADLEDQVGVLPCGNLDPKRLTALDGEERRRYARAASYHTAFVMGFLCAASLRHGMAPPRGIRGPEYAEGAVSALEVRLGSDRRHWRSALERCDPSERRTLVPTLNELVVMRALRRRDFREAEECRVAAQLFGVPPDAWQNAASETLDAITQGIVVRERESGND
ncbi:DUF6895 family protein [Microbacterium deminutum]|uniref:DUF6895 domain-containing protein n=1 Tax=Microbacterium deminutum TaxID=344164 RepID=A0ABN2R3D8_9MICO